MSHVNTYTYMIYDRGFGRITCTSGHEVILYAEVRGKYRTQVFSCDASFSRKPALKICQ